MLKNQGWLIAASTLCLALPGCMVVGITSTRIDKAALSEPDRLHFFIQGKETSNLSEDRRTITLSLIAEDPDGGQLSIDWTQDKDFGSFNSTKGKDVQWTVNREGDYTMVVTATVRGSRLTDEPDVAHFLIPVVAGKIQSTELAPEVSVAPQSVALFRLPNNPAIPEENLTAANVKRQAQLVATTYKWAPQTNTKVKQTADFEEIKWISADSNLLSVDDNGLVQIAPGANSGAALVMAASKTNSVSKAACMVTVRSLDTALDFVRIEPSGTVTRSNSNVYVDLDARLQYANPLNAGSVVYTDLSDQCLTWSSSNLDIAQVDATGRVTIQPTAQAGTVVISAISNYDRTKVATHSITVQ